MCQRQFFFIPIKRNKIARKCSINVEQHSTSWKASFQWFIIKCALIHEPWIPTWCELWKAINSQKKWKLFLCIAGVRRYVRMAIVYAWNWRFLGISKIALAARYIWILCNLSFAAVFFPSRSFFLYVSLVIVRCAHTDR